jgi:hypothetical protein
VIEQHPVGRQAPESDVRCIVDDDIEPVRRQLGADRGQAGPVALVADPEGNAGEIREIDGPVGRVDADDPALGEIGGEGLQRCAEVDAELQERYRLIGQVMEVPLMEFVDPAGVQPGSLPSENRRAICVSWSGIAAAPPILSMLSRIFVGCHERPADSLGAGDWANLTLFAPSPAP